MLHFYTVSSQFFVKKVELNKLYWYIEMLIILDSAKGNTVFFLT